MRIPPSDRDSPGGRLWSLWDIMHTFKCFEFLGDLLSLARVQAILDSQRMSGGGASAVTDKDYEDIKGHIESLVAICMESGLRAAQRKAALTSMHLDGKVAISDVASVATELRNVLEAAWLNTADVQFLYVEKDRAKYVNNPSALFGESARKAFPKAVDDMREAGNCLAADCNTAAVFHLMRVVEWGLRALCVHLGFRRLARKHRAGGRVSYVPVAYSDWEHILNELQARVDKKLARVKRGTSKQGLQEFYHPIMQDVRAMRDAWRNHVMHTRAEYNAPDADAVLAHVQRLMGKLATRVSEV